MHQRDTNGKGQPAAESSQRESAIRIGLALSGGAAKAVAHVGVLKALTEAGIVVESITGTSGGSIVGALFATGRPVEDLEQLALSLTWKTMAQVKLSRLGFLSSDKIEKFLVATMGDPTFDQLQIPFAVVATNLVTGRRHVFREGRVALACRASCSIPQVYKPMEIDGNHYVDGGLIEELPLAALTSEFRPELKVGVNLVAARDADQKPRHILHLMWRLGVIVSRTNADAMEHLADVMIRPRLHPYSGLHFRNIPEMIAEGYRAAQEAIPAIRALAAAQALSRAADRRRVVRDRGPWADGPTSLPILPPSSV
jgi:NTE family protein